MAQAPLASIPGGGMTPGKSLSPRMEVILSWDGTTPGESFYPRTEGLQESHSIPGQKDSRRVILSKGAILSWD